MMPGQPHPEAVFVRGRPSLTAARSWHVCIGDERTICGIELAELAPGRVRSQLTARDLRDGSRVCLYCDVAARGHAIAAREYGSGRRVVGIIAAVILSAIVLYAVATAALHGG